MKIYISGKITGLNYQDAFDIFEAAETDLRGKGVEPINPMKSEGEVPGKRWAEYIAEDILLIDQCDGIYMLPNWQDSNGAKLERYMCELTGKPIFYAETELPQVN